MPREIPEIVADLAAHACESRQVAVDAMRLFRAMQALPLEELDRLLGELTGGAYVLAPATPPAGWNPAMCRGYTILLRRARGLFAAP